MKVNKKHSFRLVGESANFDPDYGRFRLNKFWRRITSCFKRAQPIISRHYTTEPVFEVIADLNSTSDHVGSLESHLETALKSAKYSGVTVIIPARYVTDTSTVGMLIKLGSLYADKNITVYAPGEGLNGNLLERNVNVTRVKPALDRLPNLRLIFGPYAHSTEKREAS